MKRNMDLIRRIALATAELAHDEQLEELDGVDATEFAVHVAWMKEAGLVTAHVVEFITADPPQAVVLRLTWDGCEFADAVRDDTLWKKAKESVIKPTASFTFGLVKDWVATELRNGLPTLRG